MKSQTQHTGRAGQSGAGQDRKGWDGAGRHLDRSQVHTLGWVPSSQFPVFMKTIR